MGDYRLAAQAYLLDWLYPPGTTKECLMNCFTRTLLAVVAAASVVSSAARAQEVAAAASQLSNSDAGPAEHAALDLTAASSSSAATEFAGAGMFAGAGQSTISTQAAPVVKQQQGERRPLSSVGIGVKVGLSGVGFDVATPLVPGWLNLRGGASFFSYSGVTFTTNNIDIDGSLKFQNAEAVVDVFPFHGRFRLSGGMTTYNDTGLTATLNVPGGQSFKLGSDTYYSSATDPIHGTGALTLGSKTGGRVSIGTGNMLPRKGHFAFESEFGVQFFAEPTVVFQIQGSGCTSPTDPLSCGPVEQTDVTAEQNKLQNDLSDLKYYPILSFGFSYKIH